MSAYLLTEEAERDLNELWDYIAADSSIDQADAVAVEIRAALNLLASAPGIGHRRGDVKDPRYRFWRANRFIIAYFPDTRPLQVIRIVGGHRNFRKLFNTPRT
jgi:plasmid stabilization system protein ParE